MLRPGALLFLLVCCGDVSDPAEDGNPDGCDRDADGYDGAACGGPDCNDLDSAINPAALEAEQWDVEVVTEGTITSVAVTVGTDDVVHALYGYVEDSVDKLGHAYTEGDTWATEVINDVQNVGGYATVVMDADGALHSAVHNASTRELQHVTNARGAWTTEVVDTTLGAGVQPSIAVGADGTLHISSFVDATLDLRYAVGDAGGWSTETVTDVDESGRYSVVFATASGPEIAYLQTVAGVSSLLYGRPEGATWDSEVVFPGSAIASPGHALSGQLDAEGAVQIAYWDPLAQDVSHVTNASGAWSWQRIDRGAFPSLVVDAERRIHVSYYDGPTHAVRYAVLAEGSWTIDTVEDSENTGQKSALAVDENGVHVILYQSAGLGVLQHAFLSHKDGIDDDCDGEEW